MPQLQLPIFPDHCTQINPDLTFQRHEGNVSYLNGHLPVYACCR